MNTQNNKRRKESQDKIEKVFLQLIQRKNITEISVSTICEKAGLNAIIKKWLNGGCKETPEEMANILINEYKNKN